MRHLITICICYALFSCTYLTALATEKSDSGISFINGLSWKQIQKKAKNEGKYIFVDCFTTWCGPCKAMEKDVFFTPEVGSFFNKNFISVRLQMDKTNKDKLETKKWYSVASFFQKTYGIPSYPTYLFFSPEGQLVYRDHGFKKNALFINLGKKVLNIKKGEVGPYIKYYALLNQFLNGERNYSVMSSLADTAQILGQQELADTISAHYRSYLLTREKQEWLTAPNLKFMTNFIRGSSDPFFKVFYTMSFQVDDILQLKGKSQLVVDYIIQKEEVEPVTKPPKGIRSTAELPKGEEEPDWEALQTAITAKYDSAFGERNVLWARTQWYMDHLEWSKCAEFFTSLVTKYPPLPAYYDDRNFGGIFLNVCSWKAIFLRSVDKTQIDAAINCMKGLIGRFDEKGIIAANGRDTYANLLYKAGRKSEAIFQEEKALKESPDLQKTLDRMKQGKPTWPHYLSNLFMDEGTEE